MKFILLWSLAQAKPTMAVYQRFCYPEQNLNVTVESNNIDDGLKKAAKVCFKALTKDKYPGDEEGLKIIDICVNPKRCN